MATYTGRVQSATLYANPDDAFLNLSILTRSKSLSFYNGVGLNASKWVKTASATRNTLSLGSVSRVGRKWSSYVDIFYNRIWIIPPSIDLTGAPTNYATTVKVWNSYFTQKTMTAVTPTNLTGITFAPSVPKTFNALEIASYNFSLTNAVPASVDGYYTFTFSDAEDPTLDVNGILSVTYPYFHNWTNSLIESISFFTNIIESKNGKEQRRRLRKYPRRQLQYNILLANSDDYNNNALMRALYHNQMMFGSGKTWLVPIAQDARNLGATVASGTTTINVDTVYHDYAVDGYVFIGTSYDNYEVGRIQSMTTSTITLVAATTKTWNSGATIAPMRQCVLGQENNNGTSILYEVESQNVLWDVLAQDNVTSRYITYAPTYMYKGYPVYTPKNNFVEEPTIEFFNPQRRLDSATGLFRLDSRYQSTKERVSLRVLCSNRSEIATLIGFFISRAGKLNPCWIPTYSEDFQLTQGGVASTTNLIVKSIGYNLYIKQLAYRQDIVFIKNDGTMLFRRITGSSDNGNGTETISIDQQVGFDFQPSDFQAICFLRFCRLDSDSMELEYITSDIATTNLLFVDTYEVP